MESESSMFSVLGADSFVSGNGDDNAANGNVYGCSVATQSYLERFRLVCEEVGLEHPPFL